MGLIFLTGFMGAGKSTVGLELAILSNIIFVDVDKLIVDAEKMSINEIFAIKGESYFRNLETETLKDISKNDQLVVSTGGGCIERDSNRDLMKRAGTVVYLDTPWQDIVERLSVNRDRPLATGEDNWNKTRSLYEKRIPLYKTADFTVSTFNKTPHQVACEIAEQVNC